MKATSIFQQSQYLQEALAWERALEFYKQENAILKVRLAQALDSDIDYSFTEAAEHFNNQFVFTDELIASLLLDVRQQENMLQLSSAGDHSNDRIIKKYQHKLRLEIEKFERELSALKHAYHSRLFSL